MKKTSEMKRAEQALSSPLKPAFRVPEEGPSPSDALRRALRELGLPVRRGRGLNQIGERLEALFRPEGRGQLAPALVRNYLEAVAVRMARHGRKWKQLSDAEILAEVGARKVLIAAGKSTRFSKNEVRKQLARAGGGAPLVLQARQAVGLHCCSDVIVVDPLTAYQVLTPSFQDSEVPAREILRAVRKTAQPAPLASLIRKGSVPLAHFPDLYRRAEAVLQKRFPRNRARAQTCLDEFAAALMRPFVENKTGRFDLPHPVCDLLGRDFLLALARPWGPGEALLEGLRRLQQLALSEEVPYVIPVYSDYAPALLPHYPPIYLQAYLEAVARRAVLTVGAKSPLDKIEDRGNIVFTESAGRQVPQAIREWRDMSPEERAEAQQRLELSRQTGEAHHGLNAGVFVIDRAWCERQGPKLHQEFDHPDRAKGKLHEYWYTDLVELAARQRRPRHLVFLGADCPAGCKDEARLKLFAQQLQQAVRHILSDRGLRLGPSSRIRIDSREPVFDLESAARRIFLTTFGTIELHGDVCIEDTARITGPSVLDGRKEPVQIQGHCFVQGRISGGTFLDEIIPRDGCRAPEGNLRGTGIPGAFRIGELRHRDRQGVLDFIRKETEALLRGKIRNPAVREEALGATAALWAQPELLDAQTPEALYRHVFGWTRFACPGDPFLAEKQAELQALGPLAGEQWQSLESEIPSPESPGSRALFRELTLLATKANLFDWQSPTARALGIGRKKKNALAPFQVPDRFALDCFPLYESMVFDQGPGEFLYLADNTGEALFDALVWDFLCGLGHRVVVAAKECPAGGDATVEDVRAMVRSQPRLEKRFRQRCLRVISNGNDTYGTFLHRLPEKFRTVYESPALRAIIGKGQANLYTTAARNTLRVPYVAQYLVKGITAERLTGIRALRRDGKKIPRPVLAVIPPGTAITAHAPGTEGSRTLKALLAE